MGKERGTTGEHVQSLGHGKGDGRRSLGREMTVNMEEERGCRQRRRLRRQKPVSCLFGGFRVGNRAQLGCPAWWQRAVRGSVAVLPPEPPAPPAKPVNFFFAAFARAFRKQPAEPAEPAWDALFPPCI